MQAAASLNEAGGQLASIGLLRDPDVDSTQLAAVFGVLLGVKGNSCAFIKGFVAVTLDSGEMHKHILAAVVVADEAEALFGIEPLYSTALHNRYLLKLFTSINRKKHTLL
jgi:hypothetical protein